MRLHASLAARRIGPGDVVVQRGTVNWFYRDFTLTDATRVKFFASCDNSMDVFLDGQQIMSSSDFDQEAASFTQMARFTIRLGIGTHTLAAVWKDHLRALLAETER